VLLALLLGAARGAGAASLRAQVDSTSVYVGVPFRFSLVLDRAALRQMPQLPPLAGLDVIEGLQQGEQSTQIVNGRVVEQSITYHCRMVATREGPLEIPSIAVETDQGMLRSEAILLHAVPPETGEELLVELEGADRGYFVGESIELKLLIWIKPFSSPRHGVTLNQRDMWSLVETARSSLGRFAEGLGAVTVRDAQRRDEGGTAAAYYLYHVPLRLTPERAGSLDLGARSIAMRYPERLRVERDLFGRTQYAVDAPRLLVAPIERAVIQVEEPPVAGRPPEYAGAVGRFDINVTAHPTDVSVGEPITLSIVVTDRTRGGARLEALPPPVLEQVPGLAETFKLSSEPLAGVVEGRRKRFERTLRANRDGQVQVPPIPFVSFDPESRQYVTVRSDPIDLQVRAAGTLAMSDIVGTPLEIARGPGGLTEVSGGLLANYTDPALVLSSQRVEADWRALALVLAPPLLWLATSIGWRRASRSRLDTRLARARGARRTALRRLESARRAAAGQRADAIALALAGYVSDRCGLPAGASTRSDVVGALEQRQVAAPVVAEVHAVLAECERLVYAPGGASDADALARRAAACVRALEREGLAC
jgi:hypothetical protein